MESRLIPDEKELAKHDSVDEKKILASAPYVFDTTGEVKGAKGL